MRGEAGSPRGHALPRVRAGTAAASSAPRWGQPASTRDAPRSRGRAEVAPKHPGHTEAGIPTPAVHPAGGPQRHLQGRPARAPSVLSSEDPVPRAGRMLPQGRSSQRGVSPACLQQALRGAGWSSEGASASTT